MSTIDRIEALEKDIASASAEAKRFDEVGNLLAQRVFSLEQANASLSKVLSALSSVLIKHNVCTDAEIFKGVIDVEINQDKAEVAALLEYKQIEVANTVNSKSVVVVEQEIEGEPESYLEYRLYKLGLGGVPAAFIADLDGRTVGDVVLTKATHDKVLKLTIKEIYSVAQAAE